jgi:hypothetical protein
MILDHHILQTDWNKSINIINVRRHCHLLVPPLAICTSNIEYRLLRKKNEPILQAGC